MAKSKTLDPMNETPKAKKDLTKEFMLAYLASDKATKEDVEWFKEIISKEENRKTYENGLNGTTYEDFDLAKVRDLFAQRFYPNLIGNKKKTKLSFNDRLDLILANKK